MRLHLSLFGGNLLEPEPPTPPPFGFSGGTRCESVDIATDRDPLVERD